jgi:hypothetical protein
MTNDGDDSMETTETRTEGSGAVQVDDDANTDSGTSPPLAENTSDHHAEPSTPKVAAAETGAGPDLSHETQPPTDTPQTSESEELPADLSAKDQELARGLMAWARDMDAPTPPDRRELLGIVIPENYREDHCWQHDKRRKNNAKDLKTCPFTEEELFEDDAGVVRAVSPDELAKAIEKAGGAPKVAVRLKGAFSFAYVPSTDTAQSEEIVTFVKRHEWLGSMPQKGSHQFVARTPRGNVLAGVLVMAEPSMRAKSLLGPAHAKLERLIARGASISWAPKDLGSWLIRQSMQWMVKMTDYRTFTAYSDPDARELGTIYQAVGFAYLGSHYGADKCTTIPPATLRASRGTGSTADTSVTARSLPSATARSWR